MIGLRVDRRFAATLALAGLLALGCSQRPFTGDNPWVAEAARRHALADQLLEAGNRPAARDALTGIVEGALPAGLPAADRRAVLQDTYFRLAQIALDEGEPRSALTQAERGLALGHADDLFVANLLVVRGAAREALGAGPAAAADYHQALVINDKLLGEALPAPPAGARPAAEPR